MIFGLFILLLSISACTKESVEYTIQFDTMGGSVVEPIVAQYLDPINLPIPEREGFTFVGWYNDEQYTAEIDISAMMEFNFILYAKWQPIQYQIHFDVNGGTSISSVSYDYQETVIEPDNPIKQGYAFIGWYSDEALTIPFVFGQMGLNDLTLYAKWEPNEYQIHFVVNGGNEMESATYLYQETISAPIDPIKDGYIFDGWYTDESLTTQYIFGQMGLQDITVYAKWSAFSYKIQFENTGDSDIDDILAEAGSTIVAPDDPIRDGYEFSGWYIDALSLEPFVFSTMPNEDLTLYADWGTNGLNFTLINDDQEYEVSYQDASELETIQIPKNHEGKLVTKIADYGFGGCYSLSSFVYSPNINTIGDYAFMGCESLLMFPISEYITYIGQAAFFRCAGLEQFLVNPDNQNYMSIDGVLFSKSGDKLIAYPASKAGSNYVINDDVITIEPYSFTRSLNLTTVTFGSGVTTIKTHAFYDCWQLTSIIIPDNVTKIETYAFRSCASLVNVTLGAGLTGLDAYVFNACFALTTITIPSNITYINYGAFYDCTSLSTIIIDKTVGQGLITGGLFMFTNTKSYLHIYVPDLETKNAYVLEYYWTSYASKIEVNPGV